MNSWYKLELGDGMQAFQPTHKIQEAWFATAMLAARTNTTDYSNAVFTTSARGASLVTMYFTPSASRLAQQFGATPCEKPDDEEIGLSCGDTRAWEIHFPGLVERRQKRYR